MQFEKGDKAIHISHGAGVIVGVETRNFNGNEQSFYILEIHDNGAPKKVFVPVEAASSKLRKPCTGAERDEIIDLIYSTDDTTNGAEHQTWNRRYRQFMEDVHSGDIRKLVFVFKSLEGLKKEKDLSFGERKLFDQCKSLLEAELEIQL